MSVKITPHIQGVKSCLTLNGLIKPTYSLLGEKGREDACFRREGVTNRSDKGIGLLINSALHVAWQRVSEKASSICLVSRPNNLQAAAAAPKAP